MYIFDRFFKIYVSTSHHPIRPFVFFYFPLLQIDFSCDRSFFTSCYAGAVSVTQICNVLANARHTGIYPLNRVFTFSALVPANVRVPREEIGRKCARNRRHRQLSSRIQIADDSTGKRIRMGSRNRWTIRISV